MKTKTAWLIRIKNAHKEKQKIMKTEKNNKVKTVFYLDPEDKQLLEKHCESMRVFPSFFIRNVVLEQLGKKVFKKPDHNLDVKKYQMELIPIGNNLNQIAKKLNSNAKFLIADQKTVLNDIEKIKQHIAEIYSKL